MGVLNELGGVNKLKKMGGEINENNMAGEWNKDKYCRMKAFGEKKNLKKEKIHIEKIKRNINSGKGKNF